MVARVSAEGHFDLAGYIIRVLLALADGRMIVSFGGQGVLVDGAGHDNAVVSGLVHGHLARADGGSQSIAGQGGAVHRHAGNVVARVSAEGHFDRAGRVIRVLRARADGRMLVSFGGQLVAVGRVVQRHHILRTDTTDCQAALRSKARIGISRDIQLQASLFYHYIRDSAAISHFDLGGGILGDLRCRPSFQILHRVAQIVPQVPVSIVRSRTGGEGSRIRCYLCAAIRSSLCVPAYEGVTFTDWLRVRENISDGFASRASDTRRGIGAAVGIEDNAGFSCTPPRHKCQGFGHGLAILRSRLPAVKQPAGLTQGVASVILCAVEFWYFFTVVGFCRPCRKRTVIAGLIGHVILISGVGDSNIRIINNSTRNN